MQKINDSFELWGWRRLLTVPWTARRSNQSILKKVLPRTDTGAEAPILWGLMGRADSLENTLMLGQIEGKRRRGWQRMRWLESITNPMDMNLRKLQEIVEDGKPSMLQSVGLDMT